jgi:hypothetical protein
MADSPRHQWKKTRSLRKHDVDSITPETGTLLCGLQNLYKPSTFVKYVIKFTDITNSMQILSLCGPHNHIWQV